MKCIQYHNGTHGGTVERVSDEKAHQEVTSNKAVYVAKHVWRKFLQDAQRKDS